MRPARPVPAVESQFVTIDGCRLEYQWLGPRPGTTPTIVFLHEGLGSISRWRDFPAALSARMGWGALVYNRQGYGASDPLAGPLSPRFMHREALEVLPRVLDTFEITRLVLLGHSDGASIALINAGSSRSAPIALVAESPHVFVEDVTRASIAALSDSYRTSDLRARLHRHHGANTDALFESWTARWLGDDFRSWDIREYLQAISCPALVIQGRADEYGTLRQVDAIVDGISRRPETLILNDCGHSPHIDQREAVEGAVVAFLERLDEG